MYNSAECRLTPLMGVNRVITLITRMLAVFEKFGQLSLLGEAEKSQLPFLDDEEDAFSHFFLAHFKNSCRYISSKYLRKRQMSLSTENNVFRQ